MRTILILLVSLFCLPAHAESLWGSQGFGAFSAALTPASPETLKKVTSNYWPELQRRGGLDLTKVRRVTFKDIDPVLERAARQGLGTLDLFTQKELADPLSIALLLDAPTLQRINEKYDLSSVWMISACSLDMANRPLAMTHMIVGQGKLIIGYPFESSVEVMEAGESLHYRYEPFIEARIVNSQGQQGLFDVKTLNSPSGEFAPFEGPMGASINSFEIKDNAIVVNYRLGLEQQAHTQRKPITFKHARLALLD
jgi:hypothetical protein